MALPASVFRSPLLSHKGMNTAHHRPTLVSCLRYPVGDVIAILLDRCGKTAMGEQFIKHSRPVQHEVSAHFPRAI